MTKQEFIEAVAQAQGSQGISKKAVEAIVAETFSVMGNAIKKTSRFAYPNFGTFTVTERAARKGRNPQMGETIDIKASKSVKFKATPTFKNNL